MSAEMTRRTSPLIRFARFTMYIPPPDPSERVQEASTSCAGESGLHSEAGSPAQCYLSRRRSSVDGAEVVDEIHHVVHESLPTISAFSGVTCWGSPHTPSSLTSPASRKR